jgi:GT2 family glycosyltransferase
VKLFTVIVNYKTADMTLKAVEALLPELAPFSDARVVVVDNDSRDGSLETLSRAVRDRGHAPRVSVVAAERNGGFAYGNNFAIRPALSGDDPPEYVYLLNSDAFPEPGSVRRLVDFLDANPTAGIAGSFIHGPDGEYHQTAFRFPTIASEFESTLGFGPVSRLLDRYIVALPRPTQTLRVDWLAGASMLIRKQVFDSIGLFDETFFLYYEETDFCRRAQLAGWPTYYLPDSSVAHIGSASTGMKDKSKRTPGYWFDSRRHYFLKNHGAAYLTASNVAYVVGNALRRARWRLQRRPEIDAHGHLTDFIRHNFARPRSDPPQAPR